MVLGQAMRQSWGIDEVVDFQIPIDVNGLSLGILSVPRPWAAIAIAVSISDTANLSLGIALMPHRQPLYNEGHVIIRQNCCPSCQLHLCSRCARIWNASRRATYKINHIIFSLSMANLHIKSDTSMHPEPFSAKNVDVLALFHIFIAFIRWYASTSPND